MLFILFSQTAAVKISQTFGFDEIQAEDNRLSTYNKRKLNDYFIITIFKENIS